MRKLAAVLLAALLLLLTGCSAVPAFAPGEESSPVSSGVSSMSEALQSSGASQSPEDSAIALAPSVEEDTTVRVTIPEGFTVLQICQRLEQNGVCSGQEFFEVSQSYEPSSFTVPEDDNRPYKMEGYLFPATYEFEKNSDPTDVLITMLNAYRNRAGDLTDEQLIIASIIERESRSAENAALVSSVIYNRLDAGMMLQMDSTREYINDAVTDSPYLTGDTSRFAELYNTYKCPALPAGPICCPGERAMEAARNPAESEYYYFFFGNDNENHYSTTYEEHVAAIEEYGVQYG